MTRADDGITTFKCPNCAAPLEPRAVKLLLEQCRFCGVEIKREEEPPGVLDVPAAQYEEYTRFDAAFRSDEVTEAQVAELARRWSGVLARWDDTKAHAEFLAFAVATQQVSDAGSRYAAIVSHDDKRIWRRANLTFEAIGTVVHAKADLVLSRSWWLDDPLRLGGLWTVIGGGAGLAIGRSLGPAAGVVTAVTVGSLVFVHRWVRRYRDGRRQRILDGAIKELIDGAANR